MRLLLAAPLAVAAALAASRAEAGCCNVVKIDTELPTVTLRVCETDAEGGCGAVLFEGVLSVGQSQNVCAATGTVLYQERAPSATEYAPPVTAVCDGADVEI